MNPGELRHRVEVQSLTSLYTGDTWTKVRNQWAKINPISSSKETFLSAQGAKITHLVKFREKPAITISHRLVYQGRTYKVIAVEIFDDRQEAQAEVIQ